MKVISGFLKGRNIEGFTIDGTRPTMDRVKESLFAIIQNYIDGSMVLDLFAGSGNLGIEAISNGCSYVVFNDINPKSIKVINKNIDNFKINDKSLVTNLDYRECLASLSNKGYKFDIVFLDPPYKELVIDDIIKSLLNKNLLNDDGIIVCEVSTNYLSEYESLEKIKQKKYGDKEIIIYKKSCK